MSRVLRDATAAYLLAVALSECDLPCRDGLVAAALATKPYVMQVYDRAMQRAKNKILAFIEDVLDTDPNGEVTDEAQAAYLHLVRTSCETVWDGCPDNPPARKAAWLGLTNAVAEQIEAMFPGHTEFGAEEGVRWSMEIDKILERV